MDRRNDSFRVSNRSRKRLSSLPLSTPAEGPRHDRIHRLRRACRPPAEDPAHAPHSAGVDARRWIRRGRPAGLRADDHDRHRRPRRRRGARSRRADGEIPAYRAMPAKGRTASRSCSSCRRSSASTSTSRTSAGASPSSATGGRARAVRAPGRRVEDHRLPGDHVEGRVEGARRAGDVRPRRDRRLGRKTTARATSRSSASPASAGAGGSCGCTRRTARS